MALTGIQIFKFLPGGKKSPDANCKKCTYPTCMAYAMNLAKGKVNIDACPYIDAQLKEVFSVENRKPQEKVSIGALNQLIIGDENVMFRHDKTFVNPCGLSVKLFSSDKNFDFKLAQMLNYKIERVGNTYKIDAIALVDDSDDFVTKAKNLLELGITLILITDNFEKLQSLKNLIEKHKPLIYLTSQNLTEIATIEKIAPVIVDGKTPLELSQKCEALSGAKNIVLNLLQDVNSDIIEPLTYIRRSAIENKLQSLGFPVAVGYALSDSIATDVINLSALVCKYVNLIIIEGFNPAILTSLITLRMNIYTDPQKPLQVEPKLYEIGDVNENSYVMVTTNFALTYFAVANELEALDKGVYLIITESDGMSVLTAWSASKFTGDIIAKAVKESKVFEKVNHKKIIIPGLVAELKEEIEDELPEYEIIVGTSEATDIPEFMKNLS